MICSNCGKQIDDESKFCVHCGSKINEQNAQENQSAGVKPVEQNVPKPAPKKKSKAIPIIIVVVVALIIAGTAAAILLLGRDGSEDSITGSKKITKARTEAYDLDSGHYELTYNDDGNLVEYSDNGSNNKNVKIEYENEKVIKITETHNDNTITILDYQRDDKGRLIQASCEKPTFRELEYKIDYSYWDNDKFKDIIKRYKQSSSTLSFDESGKIKQYHSDDNSIIEEYVYDSDGHLKEHNSKYILDSKQSVDKYEYDSSTDSYTRTTVKSITGTYTTLTNLKLNEMGYELEYDSTDDKSEFYHAVYDYLVEDCSSYLVKYFDENNNLKDIYIRID